MKPQSLTLAAFGSFSQEQTLDFRALEGFFLIRGETGSGKTTLFDALVWCLYGELPGGRKNLSPRSRMVDETHQCYVDFSFLMGEKPIRVRREDKYLRAKSRGQGTTLEEGALSLWLDGDLINDHKEEKQGQIHQILGLSMEEFSKVILLPQGEFEAFLLASSTERSELMKRLFPLEAYERLSEKAQEKVRKFEMELQLKEKEIIRLDELLKDQKAETLDQEISQLNQELAALDQRIEEGVEKKSLLQEKNKAWTELVQHREALRLLRVKAPQMEELRSALHRQKQIESLKPLWNRFKKVESENRSRQGELEKIQKGLGVLKQELERWEGKVPSFQEGEKRLTEIQGLIQLRQMIQEQQGDLEEKKIRRGELQEQWKRVQKNFQERVAKKEALEKNLTLWEEEIQKFNKIDQSHHSLEQEKQALLNAQALQKRNQELKEKIQVLEGSGALNLSQDQLNKTLVNYLVNHWEKPRCPVCSHSPWTKPSFSEEPHLGPLAAQAQVDFFQSQIQPLEEQNPGRSLSQVEKDLEDLLRQDKRKGEIEEQLSQGYKGLSKIEEELYGLKSTLLTLETEGKALAQLLDQGEKTMGLAGSTPALEKEREELQKSIEEGREKIQTLQTNIKEKEAQFQSQRGYLKEGIEDQESLEREMKDLLAKEGLLWEDKIKKDFDSSLDVQQDTEVLDRWKKECQRIETHLERLERENPEDPTFALKQIGIQLEETKEKRKDKLRFKETIQTQLHALRSNLNNRESLEAQRAALIEENKDLVVLSQTLSGQGGRKVSFSAFVMQYFLESVLHHANPRLVHLSRGQYVMKLKDVNEDRRKKGGLDLVIIDGYCGEQRPPQSLSGGEKFMASLALALGLSDVITSRQGGRYLDALFIDEGFGTLDEEALDRALTILDEIRGGRSIGLISHVPGLKERIPSQVLVQKSPEGSQIALS